MADTNALIAQSVCLEQCIPPGMQFPILISLFAKIAGVSTSPTDLIDNAKCIEQCIPPGMWIPVLISLAAQIAGGGGGGGGSGAVLCGHYGGGNPGASMVVPTTTCAIAYDLDTGAIWQWADPASGGAGWY